MTTEFEDGPRFAFIVGRFPKMTETFILRELIGLEERGIRFELHSLIREGQDQLQVEAAELDRRAHYYEPFSARSLSAQWHWLTTDPTGWARTAGQALRAAGRSVDTLLRLPIIWLVAGAMARQMQADGTDRVHAHWMTYPALIALIVKGLTGIPFSATGHAADIYKEPELLGSRVGAADLVLTCTADGRRVLLEKAGADPARVVVIHHGSDLGRFRLTPLPPRDETLRVLCVAAFHDYKGQRYLLDAIRLLQDRGIEAEVTFVGDGPLEEESQALARRLGIEERTRFLGRRTQPEVRQELDRCDVFVAPSIEGGQGRVDGIPNVLVEALAVGRPVVASRLRGIAELITDHETGLLVDQRDPVGIADALAELAADPGLADRMVAAGRQKVEREHDASRNTDLVFEALRGLTVSEATS